MTPKVPLKVSYPSDAEVTVTRVFDAPRRPVFEAMTRPELAKRWLYGPEDWPLVQCEIDPKPGGRLRYVWRNTEKGEMGMSGVFRVDPIPDEDGLDLGAERCEVRGPLRRPAVEHLGAVGPRGGRQDGDARPYAAGRGQQPGIEIGHGRQELPRPDEGDWTRHAREHSRACATLPE